MQTSAASRGVLVLRTDAAVRSRAGLRTVGVAVAAAAIAAMLVVGVWVWWPQSEPVDKRDGGAGPIERLVIPAKAADLSIILDTSVMPIAPDDARAINQKRPVEVAKVLPANPFRITAASEQASQFAAALKCLTEAIYYEAASEPEAGQRAVAQVVLNRVKHPAFPNTICGVVYQGSQRATGCQFTFTCDGSLARAPAPALYRRAERFAREAVSGRIAPEVGSATNYHADYVVPYWAPSLAKIAQVGRHIFYGLRGAIGYRSAFRMRYDVTLEGPPVISPFSGPDFAVPASAVPDPLAALPGSLPATRRPAVNEDIVAGSLIPGSAQSAIDTVVQSPLRADQERGELLNPGSRIEADGAEPPQPPAAPR